MKPALPFTKWLQSGHNPMLRASNVAKHFAQDALQAAFEAGQRYENSLHEKRGTVKTSDLENPFT